MIARGYFFAQERPVRRTAKEKVWMNDGGCGFFYFYFSFLLSFPTIVTLSRLHPQVSYLPPHRQFHSVRLAPVG